MNSWAKLGSKAHSWLTIGAWNHGFSPCVEGLTLENTQNSEVKMFLELSLIHIFIRAFCSALMSSWRSAMVSPVTEIVLALKGAPEAATGYTPAV